MAFCGFEEGSALFDCTPVENMFISEYMLRAPGDFVKVYLYGLMLCYHPTEGMSLLNMAKDLDLPEEDVEHAFKYWARNGLVRQIGDNPVRFAYVNVKRLTLTHAQDPTEKLYNREFMDAVQKIFGNHILKMENIIEINEWIDTFRIPEEVILMFLTDDVAKCGTEKFSFATAHTKIDEMAQRGVTTIEDYEKYVNLTRVREKGLQNLLMSLGVRGRVASDPERKMYQRWIDEWGFTPEAVQAAVEATKAGTPTMAYLDGILLRQHQMGHHDLTALHTAMTGEQGERSFAREVMQTLGLIGRAPTQEDMEKISGWRKAGFGDDIIRMAAKEAHRDDGKGGLEDVEHKLERWKKAGFTTPEEITAARLRVRALNSQLREIYDAAGMEKKANQADRDLLCRWAGEMKMNGEMILQAAEYARGTVSPMPVITRILTDWQRAGIYSIAEAKREHEAHVSGQPSARPAQAGGKPQDVLQRQTPEERRESYAAAILDFEEE